MTINITPAGKVMAGAFAELRKGDWMQTFTGRQYWPRDPRSSEVEIRDIAAALSKQCRYGGHCRRFYSVAEHSVLIARALAARGASIRTCRTGLMHDASETYLVDVPRPIKGDLGGYYEIEAANMAVIAERYDFDWPLPPEVKYLDNQILLDERDQIMSVPPADWGIPGPALGFKIEGWTPDVAEDRFLSAFYLFGGKS